MGAVLVANSTRPGWNGMSVLVVGYRLGLQIRKPDDKHVNAKGEIFEAIKLDYAIATSFAGKWLILLAKKKGAARRSVRLLC
jgi:hypothetical protein